MAYLSSVFLPTRSWLVPLVAAVALATASCGQSSPTPTPEPTAAPAGAATSQSTSSSVPQTAGSDVSRTASLAGTPRPTATARQESNWAPGAQGDYKDLEGLKSYKSKLAFKMESRESGESSEIFISEEWIKDPPAQHIVWGDQGEDAIEIITIGNASYMKMGGQWIQSDSSSSQDSVDSMANMFPTTSEYRLVGSESVNGVNCKHYTYSGAWKYGTSQGTGVDARVEAETWIADQQGIPEIAIRQIVKVSGAEFPLPMLGGKATSDSPEDATWTMTVDVTDVNGSFQINPPRDVTTIEGMLQIETPATGAAIPASRTPAATPHAATTTALTKTATAVPAHGNVTPTVRVANGTTNASVQRTESSTDSTIDRVIVGSAGTLAVGENGSILRLEGGAWKLVDDAPTDATIRGISAAGPNDVWAVGDLGALLHYDGSTWAVVESPTEEQMNAVSVVDGQGWAVGTGGTVLRLQNGSWQPVDEAPSQETLTDVLAISPSEAWIVGDYGELLRWDGSKWSRVAGLRDYAFNAIVRQSGSGTIWVAADEAILQRQGGSWRVTDSPIGDALYGIAMSDDVGWAVGQGGIVLHYDGTDWSVVQAGDQDYDLLSVAIQPDGTAIAVGYGGTIVTLRK